VRTIIFPNGDWAVFEYDESVPELRGALCPPNRELPRPGTYILLRPGILTTTTYDSCLFTRFLLDGTPISVGLTPVSPRLRHPTISNTPLRVCLSRTHPRGVHS
jgi:hypothetical protein